MHHHLRCLLPILLLLAGGGPAALVAQELAADSLMLTWERDPTTTMTVRWLQRQPAPAIMDGGRAVAEPFAIPQVGAQEPDAAATGWWDRGLVIDFLLDPAGGRPEATDLSAEVRLAWNDDGLLLAARVRDDMAREEADNGRLYLGDSLELFVADAVGSETFYQTLVAPGIGPQHQEPRHFFTRVGEDARVRTTTRVVEGGYLTEILLPWSNLKDFVPARDKTLAFQFYINDRDETNAITRLIWYPGLNAHANAHVYHPLRLADAADAPVRARAEFVHAEPLGAIRVRADLALAGQELTVFAGNHPMATGRFTANGMQAEALIALPEPPAERQWGAVDVRVGDQHLIGITVPATRFRQPDQITVRYWPVDGDETAARSVAMDVRAVQQWPGRFVQHVTLEGLDPDRTYRFRSSNDVRTYAFRTLPTTQSRPLRFILGGDTMHTAEWMDRMTEVAMAQQPEADAVIWGGDMAYADGSPAKASRWDTWFDIVHRRLIGTDGRVVPLLVCIGNHEVQRGFYHQHPDYEQTDAWRARMAPFFYQFFPFPGQPGYAALDVGDYLSFIMLDTAHSNPIEGVQTQWLAQALAQRRAVRHVLPIYHVPAYPSVRPMSDRDSRAVREQWLPLLDQHGLNLVFEHHDHAYKRTPPIRAGAVHPEGIVFMGDGAWGVGTRKVHVAAESWHLERSESVRHAILMTLEGDTRSLRVISEDGVLIDEYVSRAAAPTP